MNEDNFGKFPSSKSLCITLNKINDKRFSAKISSIYSDYKKNMKFISKHVPERERGSFVITALLLRNFSLHCIDDIIYDSQFEYEEYLFALEQLENVIKTEHKELLRDKGIHKRPERFK